jgi:hypothetical protein
MINILVIAVLGGLKHPIGAFIGAIVFVLLQNFAIDQVDRERFNLVIGGLFLAIVLFSPDGLLGLWHSLRSVRGRRVTHPRRPPHSPTITGARHEDRQDRKCVHPQRRRCRGRLRGGRQRPGARTC